MVPGKLHGVILGSDVCMPRSSGEGLHPPFTLNHCKAAPRPLLRVCLGTNPDSPGLRPQQEPKQPHRGSGTALGLPGAAAPRSSGVETSLGHGETVGLSGKGGSTKQGAGPASSNNHLLKKGKWLGYISAAGRRAEGKPDSSPL